MDDLQLLVDLHLPGPRQGPGSTDETKRALDIANIDRSRPLRVADIGCGTGAATKVLAQELDTQVFAVDLFPQFLQRINAENVSPIAASMDALPFPEKSFDVIWSEGAIYNMGFANGLAYFKNFLKPGGIIAVSEITWTTDERPAEIQDFWHEAYPEIDTVTGKLDAVEKQGLEFIGHFILPKYCWMENYYEPLRSRYDDFLDAHNHSEAAQTLINADKEEAALYEKYHEYYSYGFYVSRLAD